MLLVSHMMLSSANEFSNFFSYINIFLVLTFLMCECIEGPLLIADFKTAAMCMKCNWGQEVQSRYRAALSVKIFCGGVWNTRALQIIHSKDHSVCKENFSCVGVAAGVSSAVKCQRRIFWAGFYRSWSLWPDTRITKTMENEERAYKAQSSLLGGVPRILVQGSCKRMWREVTWSVGSDVWITMSNIRWSESACLGCASTDWAISIPTGSCKDKSKIVYSKTNITIPNQLRCFLTKSTIPTQIRRLH